MMRINWAVAKHHVKSQEVDLIKIKSIGPIWGAWDTWRVWSTDNAICHDRQQARDLLDRAFHAVCNFYLPRDHYEFLRRPVGVKLYDGKFEQETEDIEDIIALHLAASQSDIVLMLGFNLAKIEATQDHLHNHRLVNWHGLARGILANQDQVQWVVVDHIGDLDSAYKNLPNVTCDTMQNVLKLLV